MGFRFSKRLNLPGGFRLNLGAGGLGVSWGVRGFRVGVGPNGARYTASVPGTGASWSGALSAPPTKPSAAAPRSAPADPSTAVEAFDHAMTFKKTAGFAEVVPLDPAQVSR